MGSFLNCCTVIRWPICTFQIIQRRSSDKAGRVPLDYPAKLLLLSLQVAPFVLGATTPYPHKPHYTPPPHLPHYTPPSYLPHYMYTSLIPAPLYTSLTPAPLYTSLTPAPLYTSLTPAPLQTYPHPPHYTSSSHVRTTPLPHICPLHTCLVRAPLSNSLTPFSLSFGCHFHRLFKVNVIVSAAGFVQKWVDGPGWRRTIKTLSKPLETGCFCHQLASSFHFCHFPNVTSCSVANQNLFHTISVHNSTFSVGWTCCSSWIPRGRSTGCK